MKDYFFIDSKSKSSVEQYAFVFENALFRPEDVEVAVKFHYANFFRHILCWKKYKFRLRFVFNIRENLFPDENGRVYYFFNSAENLKLIKNRKHTHIFFGHGESNKRASLHPLYRLYDYVLVAGPFAGKRLQQFDILNEATVAERVLDIGGASVANIDYDDLLIIGSEDIQPSARGLLYMPTWEGGVDSENYSTVDEPRLADFLVQTARKFSAEFICIKPHANTGTRLTALKGMLANLITTIENQGIKLVMTRKDLSVIPRSKRLALRARPCTSLKMPPNFSCAIVDVSAAESMAAKTGVPSIVLATRKNGLYAPEQYMQVKGKSVIHLADWSSMADCASHAFVQATSDYQKDYIDCFLDDGNEKFRHALTGIEADLERKRLRGSRTD